MHDGWIHSVVKQHGAKSCCQYAKKSLSTSSRTARVNVQCSLHIQQIDGLLQLPLS